jgi:hypothetical protein
MMTLAETIYRHSLHLPEQAAQEALDFIEFLEQRYSTVRTAPKSAGDTEAFLAAVAETLGDDFPDDIDDHDEEIHAKDHKISRQETLARLAEIRINFDGKPMTDREEANTSR